MKVYGTKDGDLIKQLEEHLGTSKNNEIARALGMIESNVSAVKYGRREMSLANRVKAWDLLGFEITRDRLLELLGDVGDQIRDIDRRNGNKPQNMIIKKDQNKIILEGIKLLTGECEAIVISQPDLASKLSVGVPSLVRSLMYLEDSGMIKIIKMNGMTAYVVDFDSDDSSDGYLKFSAVMHSDDNGNSLKRNEFNAPIVPSKAC